MQFFSTLEHQHVSHLADELDRTPVVRHVSAAYVPLPCNDCSSHQFSTRRGMVGDGIEDWRRFLALAYPEPRIRQQVAEVGPNPVFDPAGVQRQAFDLRRFEHGEAATAPGDRRCLIEFAGKNALHEGPLPAAAAECCRRNP